jgi:hypothetical protein
MHRTSIITGLAATLAFVVGPAWAAAAHWEAQDGDFGPNMIYDDPHGPGIGDAIDCKTHPAPLSGQTEPGTGKGLIHIAWSFRHNAHAKRGDDGIARDLSGRKEPWPAPLTLASGATTAVFPATATDDHDVDPPGFGVYVEADVPASSAVAQAFARSGSLSLGAYGLTERPVKASVAMASRFVARCAPHK